MDHLKDVILGIYSLNLAGRNVDVCRLLKEKFPEWAKEFQEVDLKALSGLKKKDKPWDAKKEEWR